jgi:hypothetical protein
MNYSELKVGKLYYFQKIAINRTIYLNHESQLIIGSHDEMKPFLFLGLSFHAFGIAIKCIAANKIGYICVASISKFESAIS